MKIFSLLILLFFSILSPAQTVTNITEEIENKSFWSKNVISLNSDTNCSSYVIRIETEVKPHYHQFHTEIIYVVNGMANLIMNNKVYKIKPGDYIYIPPKTVHSVKVTSLDWLEVISIQSPEFKGEDRVWVEEKSQ